MLSKRRTDAELKARALGRWENEGGASAAPPKPKTPIKRRGLTKKD